MRKVTKFLMMAAIVFGFAACNNEEVPPTPQEEGNTHVSVVLRMSTAGTKAATRSQDYNYVGEWAGKDLINSVAVYIIDGTTVSTGQFAKGDFTFGVDNAGNITMTPIKAIKTTPGTKEVYALINGTPEVVAKLATADATAFKEAYQTAALALANDYATKAGAQTSASNIAKVDAGSDVIVMTNSEVSTVDVIEGVTEEKALAGENRAKVSVKRTVARVMVTTAATTYDVKSSTGDVIGKVSDITWVLAQGENSLFLQQNTDLQTPKYTFKPTAADYYTTTDNGYDYSGLFENQGTGFGGTTVPTLAAYAALNDAKDNQDAVLTSLGLDANAVNGKFILPTTHATGADATSTGYNKGNTAYVLVRAKFTPTTMADGTTYTDGADFYLGANGLFYSDIANAHDPAKGGVAGQTVARYVGGKVLYYAWVNPDKVPGWLNSPVVRNNIYHIHISGFKTIGTNWNPLVPGDDPEDPNDDPNNPDPKPENPDEPETPIKPEDPLTTPETWMSVEMNVLPWLVHSYDIELGI